MFRKILTTSLIVIGVMTLSPAEASAVYTAHTSSISANSCNSSPCTEQLKSSSDFGPFSASFAPDPKTPKAYPVSRQSSLITNRVTMSMSSYKQGLIRAGSSFELDFNVDAPTDFSMSGDLSCQYSAGIAQISLTGTGTTLELLDFKCPSSRKTQTPLIGTCPAGRRSIPPVRWLRGDYELFVSATEDESNYISNPSGGHGKLHDHIRARAHFIHCVVVCNRLGGTTPSGHEELDVGRWLKVFPLVDKEF